MLSVQLGQRVVCAQDGSDHRCILGSILWLLKTVFLVTNGIFQFS